MKFKVGDKIIGNENAKRYNYTVKGWEGEVIYTKKDGFTAKDLSDGSKYWDLDYDCFDLVFTLEDLQFADIITFRNGERYVYVEECLYAENCNYDCDTDEIDNWNNETFKYCESWSEETNSDYDIVKIERNGEIIYKRDDAVKEMTVKEISEALGYEVKIIK